MNTVDLSQVKAVAFDIDGTLYKELPFNLMVSPYFLLHLNFFLKYNKVRKELRHNKPEGFYENFNQAQSELLASKLKCTPQQAQDKLNKIVYEGLKKYYRRFYF